MRPAFPCDIGIRGSGGKRNGAISIGWAENGNSNVIHGAHPCSIFRDGGERVSPNLLVKTGIKRNQGSSLEYINRQMISHRSEPFKATYSNVQSGLKSLLDTHSTPLLFTSSGTAAMASTIDNILGQNDRALTLSCGYYGDLFHQMVALRLGQNAILLRANEGCGIDVSQLSEILKHQDFKAIFLTHNESSTGVTNPLADILTVIHRLDLKH